MPTCQTPLAHACLLASRTCVYVCAQGSLTGSIRTIPRIDPTGFIDTTTTYSTTASAIPRGVATLDGINMYAGDGACIWGITYGSNAGTCLNGNYWYYGQQVNAWRRLWCVCVVCGVGCVHLRALVREGKAAYLRVCA